MDINDEDNQPDELDRINQCRQLLLEAGADPSISCHGEDYESNPFECAITSGISVSCLGLLCNSTNRNAEFNKGLFRLWPAFYKHGDL